MKQYNSTQEQNDINKSGEHSEADIRRMFRKLTEMLIEKGLTITTMESATGGQIASLITDTEGASAIFKGAFVTYSNEAKIMQGVSANTIEQFSVYSEETALEMANVCRGKYNADISIGVTGTMGNIDPYNEEASHPGRVFFAFSIKGMKDKAFCKTIKPRKTRLEYKLEVAYYICKELTKIISYL